MVKAQAVKAVVLCVTGVALFFAEAALISREAALQQVPCIVVLATLFFALGLLGGGIYIKVMRGGGKWAMTYYLLAKMTRFFLALVIFVIYAFAIRTNLLALVLNLFALYLADLVCETVFSVKVEHLKKH